MARQPGPEPADRSFPEGVLVVDKPSGPTSHDIVAMARRVTGLRRIGHLGTLDPLAQGVLPLVLGQATRLAQFLSGAEKEYEAEIRLGASTDTYDRFGTVVAASEERVSPSSLAAATVERAVAAYRGTYLQEPPPFSAKKVLGTPAYRLARRSQPVHLASVEVTVYALDIISREHDRLRLRVVCSAGFYVRSLAHALGERLGTGGYLESLIRRRSGDFSLEQATSVTRLEQDPRAAAGRVIPTSRLLSNLPALVLTADGTLRARRGALIGPGHVTGGWLRAPASLVRLLAPEGTLVAIARPTADSMLLHPGVVLD